MAELPQVLIDPTAGPVLSHVEGMDVLSRLLRDIRVSKCLQYCFEPYGEWLVDASPAPFRPPGSVSMHIVIEGDLWLDMCATRLAVGSGDVLIFPRGTAHFSVRAIRSACSARATTCRRRRGIAFRPCGIRALGGAHAFCVASSKRVCWTFSRCRRSCRR